MTTITAHEDNSGAVYIASDTQVWNLGTDTTGDHIYGQFAALAAAWSSGEWEPNENDGQTLVSEEDVEAMMRLGHDGLRHIASWRDGEVTDGQDTPGAGGAGFLGIDVEVATDDLLDVDELAKAWELSPQRVRTIMRDVTPATYQDRGNARVRVWRRVAAEITRAHLPGQGARTDLT